MERLMGAPKHTKRLPEKFVKPEIKETKCCAFSEGTALEEKIIKNLTDLLILKYLQKYPFANGYEILIYLRQKFNIPFSPGTVYNTIYSLERHALIKSSGNEIGRTYRLTDEGDMMMDTTVETRKRIQQILADIILEKY